jgi:hypothetical protein
MRPFAHDRPESGGSLLGPSEDARIRHLWEVVEDDVGRRDLLDHRLHSAGVPERVRPAQKRIDGRYAPAGSL